MNCTSMAQGPNICSEKAIKICAVKLCSLAKIVSTDRKLRFANTSQNTKKKHINKVKLEQRNKPEK